MLLFILSKINSNILNDKSRNLKVRKSWKQIMLSSILPKNERYSSVFGRIEDTINCFRDLLTFNNSIKMKKYLHKMTLEITFWTKSMIPAHCGMAWCAAEAKKSGGCPACLQHVYPLLNSRLIHLNKNSTVNSPHWSKSLINVSSVHMFYNT